MPTTRTRVLFVHEGAEWIRGSERCLLDLVASLDASRFESLVWCNARTLQSAARDVGATILPFEPAVGQELEHFFPPAPIRRAAAHVVAEHRPDVVHCNGVHGIKWVLGAARRGRVPVLAHLHLPTRPSERRWEWLHQVDLAVGVSQHAVDGLVEDGMPADRVRVILNAIDVRRLLGADGQVPATMRSTDGLVRVVSVGSLVHRKGYDVLLRAVARARRDAPALRLRIAGAGPDEASLRARAVELGIADIVEFAGETADLRGFYARGADLFVSASRLEAFNLTIAEAACLGLPVVASDIPPHREVLGEAAAAYPAVEDVEATAAAIVELACDPAARIRIGRALGERARRLFTLDRYAAEFADAYDWLRSRPRSSYSWAGAARWPRSYTDWLFGAVRRRLPGRSR